MLRQYGNEWLGAVLTVYKRAATITVVNIPDATAVSVWYGCRVYGVVKSGVAPGGGARPGTVEAIRGRDCMRSIVF